MASSPSFPVGTAAVSWTDGSGRHIRVYSTDSYNITERCWDDGQGWTNGGFRAVGAAVSATCWQEQQGVSIRVYCTFEDKTVEYCWDAGGGGWYQGGYTID